MRYSSRRVWAASIGPRLFSRGKQSRHTQTTRSTLASIGPRLFSRGKTFKSNDKPVNIRVLQLGRGFSAAESPGSNPSIRMTRKASIGPRLFSRGKLGLAVIMLWPIFASIGPRLFSRGKPRIHFQGAITPPASFNWAAAFQPRKVSVRNTNSRTVSVLQLGRGFSAAESTNAEITVRGTVPLQLGRGFSAAESPATRISRGAHLHGFNWAAAFQPRKAAEPPPA